MMTSGVATFAAPLAFNDNFTLSTANQSMWGTGAQTGWNYDSFQGIKWGTYLNTPSSPNHGPATIGVNAVTGSSSEVIIPSVCFWTPWGEQCTGALTIDSRTGASVGLTTSGQLGVGVKASANGGAVSAVLPVKTTLQVSESVNGKFHVGGSAKIDPVNGGAKISATAPSFAAGVNGIVNVDASIFAEGCFVLAGCTSGGSAGGFGFNQQLVAINTANAQPFSVLGLDLPLPGVNSFYRIRQGEPPCQGPITQSGTKPDCSTSGPVAVGNVVLAQVELDTLKNFSGGTYDQSSNLLSVSHNSPVLTLDADVIGIAQAALGLTVDVVNPSIKLNIPVIGSAVSVGVKLADLQVGIQLGLQQSFAVTPNLQVTLQFDKPVSEYVQVIDHIDPTFAGFKQVISFTQSAVNTLFAAYQQTSEYPNDEVMNGLKAGGCRIYKSSDYDGKVYAERCSPQKQSYSSTCIGSSDSGCQVNPGQDVILKPGEPFRLDLPYYVRQCRIVDANPYPWAAEQELYGTQHAIDCYTPAVISELPAYVDVPVYKTVLVDRGTSVTIDLDKGADLRFTGDVGQLVGRSYTMDDSDNFRSKAGVSIGGHERFQAGCLNAVAIAFTIHECLFDQTSYLGFGDITVFEDDFSLRGFNTVAFNNFAEPPEPPDQPVPEPPTIVLMLLALLCASKFARRNRWSTVRFQSLA